METERTASFLNLGSYDRINIILTVCHLDIDRYSVHHIWENMIFERQVENDLYLYIFITSGKYFTGCLPVCGLKARNILPTHFLIRE